MASFSIDIALNWENKDEFQCLLQNVSETKHAYQNALKELSEFKPDFQVISKKRKET